MPKTAETVAFAPSMPGVTCCTTSSGQHAIGFAIEHRQDFGLKEFLSDRRKDLTPWLDALEYNRQQAASFGMPDPSLLRH